VTKKSASALKKKTFKFVKKKPPHFKLKFLISCNYLKNVGTEFVKFPLNRTQFREKAGPIKLTWGGLAPSSQTIVSLWINPARLEKCV
jgi:hypothetical protein